MREELLPLFIVVNTNPPPAHSHPHRFTTHNSSASAEREAKRLAEAFPGQEFTVFAAVSSALREEPVRVRRYLVETEMPF